MKLLDLQLIRFGHFSERTLAFDDEARPIQLIFGRNEAGKSTTLRAITGLLFGIPERSIDAHLHRAPELRVGARLARADGQTLQIVRRKGRKDTLLDPDGTPLDESVLEPYLGGVTRDLFESMFGLSHEALVEGGRELLHGRGEVGESLFGAAAGLRGLHGLLTELELQAGEIYKVSGQKPLLNQALRGFRDARDEVKGLSLRPAQWQELERELREARARVEALQGEHARTQSRLHEREVLRNALPDLATRAELQRRQHALDDPIMLPETAIEDRKEAQRAHRESVARQEQLRAERARRGSARDALSVPEALLAEETRVRVLGDRRGAYLKALDDRRGLVARIEAGRREMAALVRELPGAEQLADRHADRHDLDSPDAPDLEAVEQLRVDAAQQARIRSLAVEGEKLGVKAGALRDAASTTRARIEHIRSTLEALPESRDAEPLRRSLAAARKAGDLESAHRELRDRIEARRASALRELEALPLWSGPLQPLTRLALPSEATIDRFEREFGLADERRRALEQRQSDVCSELDDLARKVAELESRGEIPSRDDLARARIERDESWAAVRTSWLQESPWPGSGEALAADYEARVARADDLADRMFAEHERVARLATLRAEQQRTQRAEASGEAELSSQAEHGRELARDWRAAWAATGLEPLPPREMRGWLGRQQRLVEAQAEHEDRVREADRLSGEIERHRAACEAALDALDEGPEARERSLAALLERGDRLALALAQQEQARARQRDALAEALREQREGEPEISRVEDELDGWRAAWREVVAPLQLGESAGPDEAATVLERRDGIFSKLSELRALLERVGHIRDDTREFEAFLDELVNDCAPDLPPRSAEERSAMLLERLREGRDARTERRSHETRIVEIDAELEDLERQRAAAESRLEALVQRAGCSDLAELERAEERSAEARRLAARLDEVEERLRRSGRPLDELLALAAEVDAEKLELELDALRTALEENEQQSGEWREKVGRLDTELSAMDGGPAAAEAADRAEQALADVAGLVHRYARVRLAHLVLGREMQRYGATHQGPVLERTGALFERMTLGSFAGVTSDFADNDELVILCRRPDGTRLHVGELSEGARDQLYLSLRLAALEHHLERSEPIPLVVDDVLVGFDDPRARATFELLAELSQRTQILFFTHHEKLIELAAEAIPEDRLRVHTL